MPAQPEKTHLPSVAQLILSVTGLVTCIGLAVIIWLITQLNASIRPLAVQTNQQMLPLVWLGLILSLVSIPSLILSIRRLARKHVNETHLHHSFLVASLLCILIVPLIYLTQKVPGIFLGSISRALLTVILVAIPLWWFIEFGRNRLKTGSLQRWWGFINFQIFAGMPLIIFIELIILVIIGVFTFAWLTQQPEFKPLLITLQTEMMINPSAIPNLLEQAGPLFQKPGVLAAGFFLVVLLLPLVEEIFKPLAIWFFIKRDWSPSEGFTAGLICGAAFALVESGMSVVAVPAGSWLITLIGRVGTGLLHTLTTGLTGWALVTSWRDGNFKRIGLTYLVSVAIHGTWNFFAILFGLDQNVGLFTDPLLSGLLSASPWVMGVLFVGMLTLLFLMNRKLKISMIPPPIPALPVETMG